MKKYVFFVICFLFELSAMQSQVNAIFINDNSESEENSLTVFGLLEQYLGTLTYFDANQNERSPNFSELEPYNLVIWYCGIDEDDLYFWNGNYKDNPNLIEYLNNGGNLWTIGRGFLNARYIKPPRVYSEGTFLYDFLGLKSWISESYTTDNGIGSPELLFYNDSPFTTMTLKTLNWEIPPESLVDGGELISGCFNVYIFGPAGYPLYGQPTAFYYPTSKFKNTTFTFDPADLDSKGNISTLLSDVLRFYEDILSDIDEFDRGRNGLTVFPNPTNDFLHIEYDYSGKAKLTIASIQGSIVIQKNLPQSTLGIQNITLPIQDLTDGIYMISIVTQEGTSTRKFLVSKGDF